MLLSVKNDYGIYYLVETLQLILIMIIEDGALLENSTIIIISFHACGFVLVGLTIIVIIVYKITTSHSQHLHLVLNLRF